MARVELLSQPLEARKFDPSIYRNAAGEIFTITLLLTWAMTLLWHPEQIFDHPARPIIGSLNPCFGWDYPPASYFAVVFCSVNVFLTWRYAWLENVRTRLEVARSGESRLDWAQQFARYSAIFLALSSNFWLLLWSIGPNDNNW